MHSMHQFRDDIRDVGDKVDHMESKIEEFALSFNALLDPHNDMGENNTWLKAKIADLEDI